MRKLDETMSTRRLVTASLLMFLAWGSARATKPERIVLDSYADFSTGDCQSVTLSDTGFLAPAPAVKKVGGVDPGQIWSVLPDGKGGYLLATSPNGLLLRMTADGKTATVSKFSETHIYAMARNKAGELFVATSPDGKIFKLDANDKPVVFYDPKEKYIWNLLFDDQGNLFAATGTQGKIYKITPAGQGSIYYDSDETHIRCLAWDKEGRLLAGSSDNGLLYRITAQDEGVVLCSTGRQEVNRIAVAPTGVIYCAATGTARPGSGKPNPAPSGGSNMGTMRALLNISQAEEAAKAAAASQGAAPQQAAPPGPPSGGSQIFRIDATLYPQSFWTTKETIQTLNYEDKQLLVGTGNQGYFYSLDERGRATRLFKVEAESITSFWKSDSTHFVLATANPARVFLVGGVRTESGVYLSDVVDSTAFARWGAVTVKSKGAVQVRTRSGNTPKPDKSWYPWVATQNDQSQSPAARFMQVELQIASGYVDRLELVYLPKNLAPRIDQIEILPSGVGYISLVPPPQPPQPKSADQLLVPGPRSELEGLFKPPVRYQPAESRGLRTAAWKASDPNGDELRYSVFYHVEGSTQWHQLAKDLKDTVLSWDASGWPDGNYYLKVVASDATDNAPGDEQSDELISKMFTIDNTPPVIKITSKKGGVIEFTVTEEASSLESILISKDGKEFLPLRPIDGILDSRSEQFRTKIGDGEVLFIRAEDEAGNVSSALADPSTP